MRLFLHSSCFNKSVIFNSLSLTGYLIFSVWFLFCFVVSNKPCRLCEHSDCSDQAFVFPKHTCISYVTQHPLPIASFLLMWCVHWVFFLEDMYIIWAYFKLFHRLKRIVVLVVIVFLPSVFSSFCRKQWGITTLVFT